MSWWCHSKRWRRLLHLLRLLVLLVLLLLGWWWRRLRLLMLLLLMLLVLVLVLLEMLVPKRPPAISTARDPAPISIHAAPPAPRIPAAFVMPVVGTTAWPPGVGLSLHLATPFPITLPRKALLARRRDCCPTSAPEAISIVFDLETISARTRQRL